jgi:hypothetical protein
MSRRRNQIPSDRFNVSLPRPVAERVRQLAHDQRRSGPATIAALVTCAVMQGEEGQEAEEARVQASALYQELAREKAELAAALTETRRQLAQLRKTTPAELAEMPGWAWPLDCLVADADWWSSWLPRLYELLGSDAGTVGLYGQDEPETRDERGYVDLMTHLFPPIGDLTWRSPRYPQAARADAASRSTGLRLRRPRRDTAWEPVIRHVARALAALEASEQAGADAYHAMRVQAEISGPWITVLNHLLGGSLPELRELRALAG